MFNPNPKIVLVNQFGEESINYVAPGSEFSASFKSTPVVLSAAQVIALNATPIDIVPAISGKIIQVVAVVLAFTRGSASFTVGSSKVLKAQYKTSGQQIASVPDDGFLTAVANAESVALANGGGGLAIRGKAIQLTSDDTTIASGTGSTVTATVYYNVIG